MHVGNNNMHAIKWVHVGNNNMRAIECVYTQWFETHRQDMPFPASFIDPLDAIEFIGVPAVSVPNNRVAFLELKFGKGVVESPAYPGSAGPAQGAGSSRP